MLCFRELPTYGESLLVLAKPLVDTEATRTLSLVFNSMVHPNPCLILHIDHQLDECECQVAGTVGQSVYCTPYILHACFSIMFIVYPKCLADFCKTMEFCIIPTVEIFNLLHRN